MLLLPPGHGGSVDTGLVLVVDEIVASDVGGHGPHERKADQHDVGLFDVLVGVALVLEVNASRLVEGYVQTSRLRYPRRVERLRVRRRLAHARRVLGVVNGQRSDYVRVHRVVDVRLRVFVRRQDLFNINPLVLSCIIC